MVRNSNLLSAESRGIRKTYLVYSFMPLRNQAACFKKLILREMFNGVLEIAGTKLKLYNYRHYTRFHIDRIVLACSTGFYRDQQHEIRAAIKIGRAHV